MVTLGNPILANVDRDLWPHIRKQTYRIHILPIFDGFSDWPWFTIGLQTCPNRERWVSTARWISSNFQQNGPPSLRDFPAARPNVRRLVIWCHMSGASPHDHHDHFTCFTPVQHFLPSTFQIFHPPGSGCRTTLGGWKTRTFSEAYYRNL